MDIDEFIEKVCQRPLPNNPMARIRTLAKELAEGAAEELWSISIQGVPSSAQWNKWVPISKELNKYLLDRWNDHYPSWTLLRANQYLDYREGTGTGFYITDLAFDLLEEAPLSTIFISYKRSESSAFALLVLARLKQAGLDAFLDLTLEPGEDWHAGLKERIQQRDFFILLLGKETLTSEVVRKEIAWALEGDAVVIPVWHNSFEYKTGKWDVSSEIDAVLRNNHSVRVLEESALAYNNAIVELLNRFGITP